MTTSQAHAPATPDGQATAEQRVLDQVAGMLRDVIGEDYVLDLEIGMETSFSADLELESIEFVALADRLTATYGERLDFVGFLSEKDVDEVINMTVGEVVTYIVSVTGGETATGADRSDG